MRLLDASDGSIVADRLVRAEDLPAGARYGDVPLDVALDSARVLSLQLVYAGNGALFVDALRWTSRAATWSDLEADLKAQRSGTRRPSPAANPGT
jgi:hypothetical protein